MPDSIYNINTRAYSFHSAAALQECVDAYFKFIEGEYELIQLPSKFKGAAEPVEEKNWLRQPEPPTLSGLAWYLGFADRNAFEQYEVLGKYRRKLKRARLRIEAEYEKKLHGSNATGAVFALKNMGWNDKSAVLPILNGTIKIELVRSGVATAATESDVVI